MHGAGLSTAACMGHQSMASTHRPLSSSFLGVPYRILNTNHKKELLRGLWVGTSDMRLGFGPLLAAFR